MVHFVVEELKVGEYKFVWEYDTGMGPGGENLVHVRGLGAELTRCFYFEDAEEWHVRNFCKRFAGDTEYRRACLDGTVPWVCLSELYELNAECLRREYEVRHRGTFIGFLAGNREQERVHSRLQESFSNNCRELYYFLKKNLERIVCDSAYLRCAELRRSRDPRKIDERIQPIIERLNHVKGVCTQFSCQGVAESIMIKGKKVFIPDGHSPFAHVQFGECPRSVVGRLSSYLNDVAIWRGSRLEAKRAEMNREFILCLERAVNEFE